MKKIYLIISLLILLLIICITKIKKEYFTIKNLPKDISIKEDNYKKGLYLINSYHYDKTNKILFKVNDIKSTDLNEMFSLTNSKNLEPNDLSQEDIKLIQERGSNLRIDNGIYITEETDNNDIKFSLQGLRYKKNNGTYYATSEENKITNIRFKQYYDPSSSDSDVEIKYFMTYNNKFLYIEEIDKENDIFEVKSLSMDDICIFMGKNYSYEKLLF